MRRNLAFRLPVAGAHDGAAYQRKLGETMGEGHDSARMKSLTATLVAIHHTIQTQCVINIPWCWRRFILHSACAQT